MSGDDLDLLEQDHQQIMKLISEIADTSERPTIDVVEDYFIRLRPLLSLHLRREEDAVYRPLMTHRFLRPAVERARQDHWNIEHLLAELERMTPAQRGWTDRVHDLKLRLEWHVAHEERELFPWVKAKGTPSLGAKLDRHPS